MNRKTVIIILLILLTVTGCATQASQPPKTTAPEQTQPVSEQTQPPAPEAAESQEPEQVESQESAPPEAYASVLETYRKALEEGLLEEDMSLLCAVEAGEHPLQAVGYAIVDVSGEGVEELIIAGLSPDSDGVIYDLYTMEDGAVIHLCSSTEGSRYYLSLLLDTGTACELIHVASSGAGHTEWYSLCFGGEQPRVMTVNQAIRYDMDVENPWLMGYWDGQQVLYNPTEEELATGIMEAARSNTYLPELTPFA